jgi:hypothetical protein
MFVSSVEDSGHLSSEPKYSTSETKSLVKEEMESTLLSANSEVLNRVIMSVKNSAKTC